MTVLVLNECFSDNIGDQAISFAMAKALKDRGFDVAVRDFSCRREIGNKKHNHSAGGMRRLLPTFFRRLFFLLRNFKYVVQESGKEYSFAVIGGGQLVLSNSNFPWAMLLWVLALKVRRTSVFLVSVGVGEEFSWFEKKLYRLSLGLVDGIYLRDFSSIDNLRREFDLCAEHCPDVAYYLERPALVQSTALVRKCMVCVTEYAVYRRYAGEMGGDIMALDCYIKQWLDFIKEKVVDGMDVVLVATTFEDFELSLICARELDGESHVSCLEYVPDFEGFIAMARTCEVVYAGRMHALILGHVSGASIQPYYISKKIEGYAREYLGRDVNDIRDCIASVLDEQIVSRLVDI